MPRPAAPRAARRICLAFMQSGVSHSAGGPRLICDKCGRLRGAASTAGTIRRMPRIAIRPAVADDTALILRFIRELAIYEKAEHEVAASEADIRRTLFAPDGPARALICSVDGVDAGFAVYFFNYSTWQGRK